MQKHTMALRRSMSNTEFDTRIPGAAQKKSSPPKKTMGVEGGCMA
jgi:hypothetical protein